MRLVEIMVVLALIGIFVYAVVPGKNMYSTGRRDALRVASSLRACAIYSLGNSQCSLILKGKGFRLTCSGGYSRAGRLSNSIEQERSYTCSEGVIENPAPILLGHFVVRVERRGINVEVLK